MIKKDDKFMTTLKLGTKGQIVIPKEIRDMFDINIGDNVLLLADKVRGIALVPYDNYKKFIDNTLEDKGEKK